MIIASSDPTCFPSRHASRLCRTTSNQRADATTRLVTLQELSELLSISTEDTLAGSFQVELFVKELVKILGGRGVDGGDEDDRDDQVDQDGGAALATALAMSTGGVTYQGDDNLESEVLACRFLANLMEALPGVAHTVVYHGAIPVLCSKLIEISYIDLAEQTLSVSLNHLSMSFLIRACSRWKKYRRNGIPDFDRSRGHARAVLLLCSITSTSFLSQSNAPLFKRLPIVVATFPQSISRWFLVSGPSFIIV
jgi:hypothetical protein